MKEVYADFPITSVTLYPDSARICRKTSVELPAGEAVIRATGLPGNLDPASIRVEKEPGSKLIVTGVGLAGHSAKEDPSLAHTKMARELEGLMLHRQKLQNAINASDDEMDLFVQKASLVDHEPADRFLTVNVESWKEFYPFLRTRLSENRKASRELVFELIDLETKISAAKKNMALQASPNTQCADMEIHCEAETAGNYPLSVYYLADNTGWYPCYTFSADMSGKIFTVSMHAIVSQATGEDWKGVEILLSTAHPLFSCTIPRLVSRRLREIDAEMQINKRPAPAAMLSAAMPVQEAESMKVANEMVMDEAPMRASMAKEKRSGRMAKKAAPMKSMAKGMAAPADEEVNADYYEKERQEEGPAASKPAPLQSSVESMAHDFDRVLRAQPRPGFISPHVRDLARLIAARDSGEPQVPGGIASSLPVWCQAGTSPLSSLGGYDYRFKVSGKRDIVSSSFPQKIMAVQKELGFESSFVTVPLEKEEVYLRAGFANDLENPLPEGPAQVYADQSLLGAMHLATLSEGEKGYVSLGVDQDIKVRRHENRSRRRKGMIGKDVVNDYAVEIELVNFKKEPVTVHVLDRWPDAPDVREIQVQDFKSTPEAEKRRDKILAWSVKLAPREKQTIRFTYSIRHPENYRLEAAECEPAVLPGPEVK